VLPQPTYALTMADSFHTHTFILYRSWVMLQCRTYCPAAIKPSLKLCKDQATQRAMSRLRNDGGSQSSGAPFFCFASFTVAASSRASCAANGCSGKSTLKRIRSQPSALFHLHYWRGSSLTLSLCQHKCPQLALTALLDGAQSCSCHSQGFTLSGDLSHTGLQHSIDSCRIK
jgi:hypothetical protein